MSLAQDHRRAQLAVRAATLKDLLKLWPAFDVSRINRTWPALEASLLTLIRERGRTSSGLSVAYYERQRSAAGARGRATPRVASIDESSVIQGLRAVGPANAGLQLAKNRPSEVVARATFVNLSGEVTRNVLGLGRETLTTSLLTDQKQNGTKVGVQRVTSGNPCSWCAEQALTVYPPTERFPAHMHCSCFPAATFR